MSKGIEDGMSDRQRHRGIVTLERVGAHMNMRQLSCGHWKMVARFWTIKAQSGCEGPEEKVHNHTPADCYRSCSSLGLSKGRKALDQSCKARRIAAAAVDLAVLARPRPLWWHGSMTCKGKKPVSTGLSENS
jgi:hypothetical protein